MTTYIHSIETLLPPYSYRQDYARDRMREWLPGKRNRRLINGIYDHSGIETRYSVLPDFVPGAEPVLFHEDADGRILEPTTGPRNRLFQQAARPMYSEVARRAVAHTPGCKVGDITHVITASCTGCYNPGPDYDIIRALGLPDTTECYNLGFMGCYAAFPALRMASQFCQARPDAVVLVVCLEFCTLHVQFREEVDSILANSLFADGAAAAIVSAREPAQESAAFAIDSFRSALAPEGVGDMAWEIGDHGFDIRLSSYVPKVIGANIRKFIDDILQSSPLGIDEIKHWAIHPGGRAILDRIETELHLAPEQIKDPREVLREYGNMSSATVLFVLKRILYRPDEKHPICAMAFGPGLTIETALLEYQPAAKVEASKDLSVHV